MKTEGGVHRYYYEHEPWTPASWHGCYKQTRFSDYTAERELVIIEELLELNPDDVILDAGCGYGRVAERLLSKGATVVGVDISRQMISHCHQTLHGKFVGAIADVAALPFCASTFDKIVCAGVLVHVEFPEQVICEFARVLKPGGTFVTVNNNSLLLYYSLFHSFRFFMADCIQWLRGRPSRRPIMRYCSPFWYAGLMRKSGLCIEEMQGDTFLGVLKVRGFTLFPPKFLLPWFQRLDRLATMAPLKYLTFASYIRACKADPVRRHGRACYEVGLRPKSAGASPTD